MGADQVGRVSRLLPAAVRESLATWRAPLLTAEIGIAKTSKYASRDSGDTAEVVERPGGGLSAVLVDGQGSGRAAKLLSSALAGKAVALLKEGGRDGLVARATHDYLHTYRGGQVSASLAIASVDLVSQTIVLTRNSECPSLWYDGQTWRLVPATSMAIGPHRHTRPEVIQLPLTVGAVLVVVSDGIMNAGQRAGRPFDLTAWQPTDPQLLTDAPRLAGSLLSAALAADADRPGDDMTVIVLAIRHEPDSTAPTVRRLAVVLPLDTLPAPRA